MEALADKVHKQGEHIPQHCYISHNHDHPYISSSVDFYASVGGAPRHTVVVCVSVCLSRAFLCNG